MTTQILRVDASLFGAEGVSSQLNKTLVTLLSEHFKDVSVSARDFGLQPLPHFSAEYVAALATAPEKRNLAQQHSVALADELIAEVQQADVLVVAAPMYNFGVPSGLKAWMDYIARAGVTFRYTENGPQGLLHNKTVYLVTTRGGVHKEQSSDAQIPYLQNYFAFLGVDDVRVIYAEGINMGQKEESIQQAIQAMQQAIAA